MTAAAVGTKVRGVGDQPQGVHRRHHQGLVPRASWGRWRAPIRPTPDTNTLGRDGFYLHGEDRPNRPDSAGCVDIGDCDSWARGWAMEKPDDPIKFIVNYAQRRVCN